MLELGRCHGSASWVSCHVEAVWGRWIACATLSTLQAQSRHMDLLMERAYLRCILTTRGGRTVDAKTQESRAQEKQPRYITRDYVFPWCLLHDRCFSIKPFIVLTMA